MYHRVFLIFILLIHICISVLSFNYTNCDHAKQPKFMSSCCDVQKNDKTIKTCRKFLLNQNSTSKNAGSTNLRSDKVALNAVSLKMFLKVIFIKICLLQCIAECSFKANGFLLNNGTVNVTALQKNYQQRYKNDPATSKLMVKSVAQCASYAQERVQQSDWMHTKGECNFYPATLLACIMEQVYLNCPSTKWKNTDDCAAMRKYLMDCDDVERKK
ncbi:hypothetical protein KR074_001625 [Drosophila pseudoananassae]|nr:hypothetical protein KR074_001625 [Drosophila pseudoananassae]